MFGVGDTVQIYHGNTTAEKRTLKVLSVKNVDDFTVEMRVEGDTSGIVKGDSIENLSAQADLHIKSCRFGKAKTHLRFQTRGKILMEDCECSLKILLPGDKNYWYEGSPVRDLTIRNCRFIGENAKLLSDPEFDVTEASPYYHSGIKVIGNSFDTTEAMNLKHCDAILFEGNTNTQGLPFTNLYTDCGSVTEK